MSVLVARYAWLQVDQHHHFTVISGQNRVQLRPLLPRRGLIYARGGEVLADHLPSSSLAIVPETAGDPNALIAELKSIISLSDYEIKQFWNLAKKNASSGQIPLRFGLDDQTIARLAVNKYRLPGVELEERLVRHYPYNNLFSHVLGYIGAINQEERRQIQEADLQRIYGGTYLIGKTGVEQSYEQALHGMNGYTYVEVNARGHTQRILGSDPAVVGQDVHMHMDVEVQRAARQAMEGKRGAVVALDVRNGGVVALLSMPDFNPNDFTLSAPRSVLESLHGSDSKPLFNRTINGRYSPASTFKPVVALATLSSPLGAKYTVNDPGYYLLGDRVYYDWLEGGHGVVDLHLAIVESCDTYFYSAALEIGDQPIVDVAHQFGLGELTGVDLRGEYSGILPGAQWKMSNFGRRWFGGDTLNLSIGQGDLLLTPMQMATMTMALANRGKRWQPQLVRAIGNKPIAPQSMGEIDIAKEHWQILHKALQGVVHEPGGTAHMISNGLKYRIAGKTGTVQITSLERKAPGEGGHLHKDHILPRPEQKKKAWHLRDHAVFVGYAPANNPTLAVAVVVEHGQLGGHVAAPIARKVFDAWLQEER
jgi:penicillin-binding protein 2